MLRKFNAEIVPVSVRAPLSLASSRRRRCPPFRSSPNDVTGTEKKQNDRYGVTRQTEGKEGGHGTRQDGGGVVPQLKQQEGAKLS